MTKNKITEIESFTVEEAINKVKSEAMTNVILFSSMPSLTESDRMYLMYFFGTQKNLPTKLVF